MMSLGIYGNIDRNKEQPRTSLPGLQKGKEALRISRLIKMRSFKLIIGMLSIYSVLADDFRIAFTQGTGFDAYFDCSIIVCIVAFSVDLFLQVLCKPSYFLHFYFFLDFVSTVLLLFDVSLISSMVEDYTFVDALLNSGKQLRIIRLVRMLCMSPTFVFLKRKLLHLPDPPSARPTLSKRLPRLPRPVFRKRVTLMSNTTATEAADEDELLERELEQEKLHPRLGNLVHIASQNDAGPKNHHLSTEESRVGRNLSDKNTAKIGILVILSSMITPLVVSHDDIVSAAYLAVSDIAQGFKSEDEGVSFAFALAAATSFLDIQNDPSLVSTLGWISTSMNFTPTDAFRGRLLTASRYFHLSAFQLKQLSSQWSLGCSPDSSLVSFQLDPALQGCPSPRIRRPTELLQITSLDGTFTLIFDVRASIKWNGIFAILNTIFRILLIILFSLVFYLDCSRLILIPISRMVTTIRKIQGNPVCSNSLIEMEQKREIEYEEAKQTWDTLPFWRKIFARKPQILFEDSYREYANNDSANLEATILKLGSLLLVGFGEAGMEIVSENISSSLQESTVQTTRPGKRVEAIYGYISIRNFNTITEILQDGVVVLVNRVADIVHGIVDEFNGYTSKNYGSGFLVLWRLDKGNSEVKTRTAELAILAFAEIVAAVERSPSLAIYREHPHLNMKLPGFKVSLSMALHAGYAIEGAVGSEFKLDATYLGQDVVISRKLEELALNKYRCRILVSGTVVELVSNKMKTSSLCRRIVTLQMDQLILDIYTIDLDCSDLRVAKPQTVDERAAFCEKWDSHRLPRDFMAREAKSERKKSKFNTNQFNPMLHLQQHQLGAMRRRFESKQGKLFYQIFRKGFLNYEAKEFEVAKKALLQAFVYWVPQARDKINTLRRVDEDTIARFELMEGADGPSAALLREIVCRER